MKTKHIPALIMLLGGLVACIVTIINNYSLKDMLVVLTLTLIGFLILGVIIRLILDSFEIASDEKVDDEGEVVEKQVEASDEDEEENLEEEDSDFEEDES